MGSIWYYVAAAALAAAGSGIGTLAGDGPVGPIVGAFLGALLAPALLLMAAGARYRWSRRAT
jgi:hypothetical protein